MSLLSSGTPGGKTTPLAVETRGINFAMARALYERGARVAAMSREARRSEGTVAALPGSVTE